MNCKCIESLKLYIFSRAKLEKSAFRKKKLLQKLDTNLSFFFFFIAFFVKS